MFKFLVMFGLLTLFIYVGFNYALLPIGAKYISQLANMPMLNGYQSAGFSAVVCGILAVMKLK